MNSGAMLSTFSVSFETGSCTENNRESGTVVRSKSAAAKSMLSELLSAGVSGTSALTIQGTAGTSEEHLRYSWNYALLLAQGPAVFGGQSQPLPAVLMLGL